MLAGHNWVTSAAIFSGGYYGYGEQMGNRAGVRSDPADPVRDTASFIPAVGRTGARGCTSWARAGIRRSYKRLYRRRGHASMQRRHYRRHLARS